MALAVPLVSFLLDWWLSVTCETGNQQRRQQQQALVSQYAGEHSNRTEDLPYAKAAAVRKNSNGITSRKLGGSHRCRSLYCCST
jgi:hypothetical protein